MSAVPWAVYVSALDLKTATVFGVLVHRPDWMTSSIWQDLWRGRYKANIPFSRLHALVFDQVIERSAGVTAQEWINFWLDRSTQRV